MLPTLDPTDTRATRRAIHSFPELGFCEILTADLAWRALERLGWALKGGQSLIDLEGYPGLPDKVELDAACVNARAQGASKQAVDRFAGGNTAFVAELSGDTPGPTVALRVDMDALPILENCHANHLPFREGFVSRNIGRMHACGHDGHIAIGLKVAANLAGIATSRVVSG